MHPNAAYDLGFAPTGGPSGEGAIGRGWRLTKTAWRLLRRDRRLVALAALGVGTGMLGVVALLGFGGFLDGHPPSRGRFLVVLLVAAWPLSFVSVFFEVALAAAADAALRGERMSVREALAVSVGKLGQIALWSLLAAGVGALLQLVAERLPWGGRLASLVLGAGWTVLTLLAVPVLAIEGCAGPACVRRSTRLLRGRWGDGAAGTAVITAWTLVVAAPAGGVLGAGFGLLPDAPAVGVPLVLVGLVTLLLGSGLAAAARGVFGVVLYRFAADEAVLGGFARSDLERPFKPRRRLLPNRWRS